MPRRIPLRARVALWMCATALVSLVLFAVAVWTFVRLEEAETDDTPASEQDEQDEPDETASEQILDAALIAGPIAIAAAVGLGAVWSRRITRPLNGVVDTARGMTTARLDARLDVPGGNDELAELVDSLNGLFARLEEGFTALDRHVTEASHELRTPIAVASARLQVALRHPRTSEEWTKIARRNLGDIERMARLTDALLRLARADASAAEPGGRFDVVPALRELVETFLERATSLGLSLELHAGEPSVVIDGDEDALLVAVRALLDNAMDHAPEHGAVALSVSVDGTDVDIHVDDNGPGVAPEDRERIFRPYVRGAGQGDHDGLGLGLSIARRLVERCHGTLSVAGAPQGGARFTIHLHAAVARAPC